jgi:hypothetical protein
MLFPSHKALQRAFALDLLWAFCSARRISGHSLDLDQRCSALDPTTSTHGHRIGMATVLRTGSGRTRLIGRVIRNAVASARRWGAIGAFRLASSILRRGMIQHRQRRISRRGLQTVLSATRLLERLGAFLALGRRWRCRRACGGHGRAGRYQCGARLCCGSRPPRAVTP